STARNRAHAFGPRPATDPSDPVDGEAAWQLLRDDPFDRLRTDEELEMLVADAAAKSATPYADVLRRMLGMDELEEVAARAFFRRVLEHRRRMTKALGREVHVRV